MPIKIKCDECGHAFTVADYQEGERVLCPECGEQFRVPSAEQVALQQELSRFATREISPVDESLRTNPQEGPPAASEEEPVKGAAPPAASRQTPKASGGDTAERAFGKSENGTAPSPDEDDAATKDMPPVGGDVAAQIAKESAMFAAEEHDEPAAEPADETLAPEPEKPEELARTQEAPVQQPQFREEEEPATPRPAPVAPAPPPAAEEPKRRPSPLLPRAARVFQVVILILIALALVECFENSWSVLADRPAAGLRPVPALAEGTVTAKPIPELATRVRLALFAFLTMMALRLIVKTRMLPVAYAGEGAASERGMVGLLAHSAILAALVGLVAWTAAEIDQPSATANNLGMLCAALLLGTAVWMLLLRLASGIKSAPLAGWFANDLLFGTAIIFVLLQGVPIADYGTAAGIAVLGLTNSAIAIAIGAGFFFGERGVGKGMKSFAVLILMLILIALIALYLGGIV